VRLPLLNSTAFTNKAIKAVRFITPPPQQLAWKNMYLTSEGQEKGEKWARKANLGQRPIGHQKQDQGRRLTR
jgi:hypothetical protein